VRLGFEALDKVGGHVAPGTRMEIGNLTPVVSLASDVEVLS